MDVLNFGYSLLWVTVILLVAIVSLCLVGIQTRDRRYIKSARVGLYVNFILIFAAAGTLVWGFITGCYNNEYIWG